MFTACFRGGSARSVLLGGRKSQAAAQFATRNTAIFLVPFPGMLHQGEKIGMAAHAHRFPVRVFERDESGNGFAAHTDNHRFFRDCTDVFRQRRCCLLDSQSFHKSMVSLPNRTRRRSLTPTARTKTASRTVLCSRVVRARRWPSASGEYSMRYDKLDHPFPYWNCPEQTHGIKIMPWLARWYKPHS